MRHSRRAVMAERYKLYAKKNILNSRYFVRNMQIGLLVFVFVSMLIGTLAVMCSSSEDEAVVANTKVSVKEALFSNSEQGNVVTEEVTTEEEITTAEATESVFAEKVQTELDHAITEVVSNVMPTEEEKTKESRSVFDNKCIANVDETLNIRKEPSADSEFVGQMNNGAIAIVQGTEGEWTKIKSGDVEGYVLTEYVLTGASAEEFAKDYVTLRGIVLEDGVNVRAEQSTEAEIITVMDKDDIITVLEASQEVVAEEDLAKTEKETTVELELETEETIEKTTETSTEEEAKEKETETEDIDWIPVMLEDGQAGYVSADLIEIDELYEIAVSATELQRRADEEAARKAAEEEAARQAAAIQNSQPSGNTSNSNNNDSYKGATTEPVTAKDSGEYIGTFTITAYCGCRKCSAGNNKTASGTIPTEGRTIAADTRILPFGTQVVIGGIVYTVEDSGSGVSGNHIDIFFATHSKALAFGRKTMKVYKY